MSETNKSVGERADYPMPQGQTIYRHDCPNCGHAVALLHNGPVICNVCPMLAQARREQREKDAAIVMKYSKPVKDGGYGVVLDGIAKEIEHA